MKKLIIYGIGSFAEYVAYAFENDSEYKVVGFCIEKKLLEKAEFSELPLVAFENIAEIFSPEEHSIFIAVGDNIIRERFLTLTKAMNYPIATFISSQCSKWENLIIGDNCFVDEGCIIQPFVKILNNCILFAAEIGHHSIIQSNTLISGAITGGNVTIGEFCNIGLKSAIKQNLTIGKHAVIGMGCIIEANVRDREVYSHKGTKKRNITSDQLGNRFLK